MSEQLRRWRDEVSANDADLFGDSISNWGTDDDYNPDPDKEQDSPVLHIVEHDTDNKYDHKVAQNRRDSQINKYDDQLRELYRELGLDDTPPYPTNNSTARLTDNAYTVAEIDWSEFWNEDLTARDYALDPLAPRGRPVTVISKAKEGKSELVLWCTVQRALGRKALAQPAGDPVEVLYVDHEMTATDIQERLTDMGIDEDSDLTHLHYVLMPAAAKLDTKAGGAALVEHVDRTGAQVVVIDTASKVVEGDENDAPTWTNYWDHTGKPLHGRGVTVIVLDHSGHTSTRARGSSAKQAVFDVIWELTRQTDGVSLKATHRRVSWVPQQVAFARKEDPVRYEANNPSLWPVGIEDAVAKLDDAGVPIGATVREARKVLRDAGISLQTAHLSAALKWRRDPANAAEHAAEHAFHGPAEHGAEHSDEN